MLAEHQALEQAKTIAREVSERVLEGAIRSRLPSEGDLERALKGLSTPADDPIGQAGNGVAPRVAIVVDPDDRLIYPPPSAPVPAPEPLDEAELNAEQLEKWGALQDQFISAETNETVDAALQGFLSTQPAARFAELARYRAALFDRKAGRDLEAVVLLRELLDASAELVTETGFPLRDFVELHLLSLSPDVSRKNIVGSLCSRAIAQPTTLSPMILKAAAELDGSAEEWKSLFAIHDSARAFAERFTGHEPFESDGEREFVFAEPVGANRWIHAVSRDDLAEAVGQIVRGQSLPVYFRLATFLGEVPLPPLTNLVRGSDALATATTDISTARGKLPLTVQVYLADARGFYAQQRNRTLRFGALIALSAIAVLIGFFAAWRAFRRQQQLSEMKTNFVSSVSHELRAPIASVRFMAEELELGAAPSAAKLRDYHRFIVQECRRLSAVIENVLDFSRREQGRERFEFEPIDLVRLFEETVRLMQTYGVEKNVHIEPCITGEPSELEADGRALQRLLVNLLDNAIKHSPEYGRVRAGLDFEESRALLWIEDDGPGIPREEHARIFERFYRIGSELRRETQGVGLGLSIVKHIAEVHGGQVHLHSEVGKGSRFSVELPLVRHETPVAIAV